jgi:hypothetical protein
MSDFFSALDQELRTAARARRPPARRRVGVALALVAPVAASLAVGALLVAGHHHRAQFSTGGRPQLQRQFPSGAEERQRATDLMALFRRPRTAADRVAYPYSSGLPRRVVRNYRASRADSRLAATAHGFAVYLYVPPFDPPLRLASGREYGLCFFTTYRGRAAGGGCGIIDDAFASGARLPGEVAGGRRPGLYIPFFVFPDGIRFATLELVDGRMITAPVRNNVTFTSSRTPVRLIRWRDKRGIPHHVLLHQARGG